MKTISGSPTKNAKGKPEYSSQCISEFSLNAEGELKLGREEAKYIYKEMVREHDGINLLDGMNQQVENRRTGDLNNLFDWLIKTARGDSNLKEAVRGCEFVCRRGPFVRIAKSPYANSDENDEAMKIFCTKYKGICFIVEEADEYNERQKTDLDNERQKKDLDNERQKTNLDKKKGSYAGLKFEQIVTSNDPTKQPDHSQPINPNVEFIGVFECTLTKQNKLKILCTAQIDAIQEETNGHEFIELKTHSGQIENPFLNDLAANQKNKNKLRIRYLNWYLQSYLVGIKRLLVGYRDDNFLLNKVDYFTLDRLPELFRPWDVKVCLNFLHDFLETIKIELNNYPEGTILLAERPKNGFDFKLSSIQQVISDEFKAHGWTE